MGTVISSKRQPETWFLRLWRMHDSNKLLQPNMQRFREGDSAENGKSPGCFASKVPCATL